MLGLVGGPRGKAGAAGTQVRLPNQLLRHFDQVLMFVVQVPADKKKDGFET